MAARHLKAVPEAVVAAANETSGELHHLPRPESTAQRIRRLQVEARVLVHEQVAAFAQALNDMAVEAEVIAEGGEAYPVGVREMAARVADDLRQKVQTIGAIMDRIPPL